MGTQPGCLAILLAILVAVGGLTVVSQDESVRPTPAPIFEASPAP